MDNWLRVAGKRPKFVKAGEPYDNASSDYWRWTLPDPPPDRAPHELPKEVFDRLPVGGGRRPWLFDTESSAMIAAGIAVEAALHAGWAGR